MAAEAEPKKPKSDRKARWGPGSVVTTRRNVRVPLAGPVSGRRHLTLLAGTAWTVAGVEPVYRKASGRPVDFRYRLTIPGYAWSLVRRQGRLKPLRARGER